MSESGANHYMVHTVFQADLQANLNDFLLHIDYFTQISMDFGMESFKFPVKASNCIAEALIYEL